MRPPTYAPTNERAPHDPFMWRRIGGYLLGWIVALWVRSLRVRVLDSVGSCGGSASTPWILVFFHGSQFAMLAWKRRRRTAVLVSWSRDGALQTRVLRRAGLEVVRGSTSRGGATGLRGVVRRIRAAGLDAAFAVDGPRGPAGSVQPGAGACARAVRGVLVPIGSAASPSIRLRGSWDSFAIPLPFARAVVALGPSLPSDAPPDDVATAIANASSRAEEALRCRAWLPRRSTPLRPEPWRRRETPGNS